MDEAQRIHDAVNGAVSPQIERIVNYQSYMYFIERVKLSVQSLVFHGYIKAPVTYQVPVKFGLNPKSYTVTVSLQADLFGELGITVHSRDLETYVEKMSR